MNAIILGAGIGAILLSILWTIAFILCFVSLRTKYNIGPLAVSIAIFITFILLSIPRKSDTVPSKSGEKDCVRYRVAVSSSCQVLWKSNKQDQLNRGI
ncbi:hypothetical protein PGB90_005138 [Kerria lacca]